MATKLNDSCLQKAAEDEPIFVLRAKDTLAPGLVEEWADRAAAQGAPDGKVAEARMQADQMRAWQQIHGSHVPD